MEVHLKGGEEKITLEFLQTFKDLQLQGNYRIFYWEANYIWNIANKQFNYLPYAEIVLRKINPEKSCAK